MSKLEERLDVKIRQLEEELKNPECEINHHFTPSAFLYYLKEIRGDAPMLPKQECPFDI